MTATKKPWTPSSIALQLTDEEGELLLSALATSAEQYSKPSSDLYDRIKKAFYPKTVEVCAKCGNPDIQLEGWTNFNGGADGGGDPPGGTWCSECDENDIETKTVSAEDVSEEWRAP